MEQREKSSSRLRKIGLSFGHRNEMVGPKGKMLSANNVLPDPPSAQSFDGALEPVALSKASPRAPRVFSREVSSQKIHGVVGEWLKPIVC